MDNYYNYIPTLDRKNELLHALDCLKKDLEMASWYSQYHIQEAINGVEKELTYYKKRIFDFDSGEPNVIYKLHYIDYTDDELLDTDKLMKDKQLQLAGMFSI